MKTREDWLNAAVKKLSPLFKASGHAIPKVRVSVGFPGGGSARTRIGEYWHAKAAQDGVPQIFISPVLNDPVEHLDVLVHELIHACTPGHGHKGEFKRLAIKLGMKGPMKHAGAGDKLKEELKTLSTRLGKFPHGGLSLVDRRKQKTFLIKVWCNECGYTARTTAKWIDNVGSPLCQCNSLPMLY